MRLELENGGLDMRTATLVPLLLAVASVASADELTRRVSSAAMAAAQNSSNAATAPPTREGSDARRRRPEAGPTESFNDSICATMRTYIVKRVQGDTDETRVVGYARCQPAWKFQLRTADQRVSDRGRDDQDVGKEPLTPDR